MVEIIIADLCDSRHADALVSLLDCYARDPAGGGKGLSVFVRENLARILNDREGCHVILAYVNKKPVGLLISFEGFSTFTCKPLLNIHDIVVIPEFRGKGISSQLLREAERIALKKDCCKMTLEVLEGNLPAITSYNRFGFVNYQLGPEFGKAVFMEKKLS